jgi:hypothetical protein
MLCALRTRSPRSSTEPQSTVTRRWLRTIAALCAVGVLLLSSACSSVSLFRQYEYEEEVYLSLNGSATIYVNSSVPALNALRGTAFDESPASRVDTSGVRAYYSTPETRVVRVSQSRRNNRRFVHVRIDVDDIRRLGAAAPFAWSTYQLTRDGDLFKYAQTVGAPSGKDNGHAGWTGKEIVAFRLHLPSRIRYHNTQRDVGRGNILVWEQSLTDRLRGIPVQLDARMDPQSILNTALWLFGLTFVAVALAFCGVIWWVMRRGAKPNEAGQP